MSVLEGRRTSTALLPAGLWRGLGLGALVFIASFPLWAH